MLIRCNYEITCTKNVAYIDALGIVYCRDHGIFLQKAKRPGLRELKSSEIKKLNKGKPI